MKLIKTKRTINEECWNLNYELVKWLNKHLKVYLEDASKVIDLEFHKYKYKRKTYTQKELIERLITITDTIISDCIWTSKNTKLVNEMYDLLKLVHFALWW